MGPEPEARLLYEACFEGAPLVRLVDSWYTTERPPVAPEGPLERLLPSLPLLLVPVL